MTVSPTARHRGARIHGHAGGRDGGGQAAGGEGGGVWGAVLFIFGKPTSPTCSLPHTHRPAFRSVSLLRREPRQIESDTT